ncbi:MAG TPA: TRAP transporter small permease [Syntrophorhabdaceae bacterium]|nr:TRAP transporter small permease [Syntrophorhabdaceae bacterium]
MEIVLGVVEKLSKLMQVVSGATLTCLMFLTTADVIGRTFGHPIIGTYELVGLGGAIVIGFAMPMTSWTHGHISVEALYEKWPRNVQRFASIATRLIGIALFIFIGWNLYKLGSDLRIAREVTLTRQIPFYPVAYGLAFCCLGQILALIADSIKVMGGRNE